MIEHPNIREWAVNISQEEDDPLVLGPYTRAKAIALKEAFNEQIERGAFDGEGWIHATAMRLDNPQSVTAMLEIFGKKPRRS